jgi:hypothetical protein
MPFMNLAGIADCMADLLHIFFNIYKKNVMDWPYFFGSMLSWSDFR